MALMPKLKAALDFLGFSTKEKLTVEDAELLFGALGIEAGPSQVASFTAEVGLRSAQRQACANAGSSDVPQWPQLVMDSLQRVHALSVPNGYYCVVLTLAEAEAVRLALHTRAGQEHLLNERPGCRVALRVVDRDPAGLSVLDTSAGWQEPAFRSHAVALAHCLHFIGADPQFSNVDLETLRRSLRQSLWESAPPTQVDGLREFFLASHACRRRPQLGNIEDLPIAPLFVGEAEHTSRLRQATFREAYARLLDIGYSSSDAFKMLDHDGDNEITPADFGGGFNLRLNLPCRLAMRLFEAIDQQNQAMISVRDWTAAFAEDEASGRRFSQLQQEDHEHMMTRTESGTLIKPPGNVPLESLRRISIEVVNHTAYAPLWNSEGTMCRKNASVWAATQLSSGFLRVTSLRLEVGHYANQGFADVRGGRSAGAGKRTILQVRDTSFFSNAASQEYLSAVADHYCPFPKGFREVWNQQRGKPLYVWRALPPNDAFVTLGMVVTSTPQPPDVKCMRCIAKSFCRPARRNPVLLWDDGGMGGKPGSIWVVNAMQLLWVAVGHNIPEETFWELADDSITFNYDGRPSVDVIHERAD